MSLQVKEKIMFCPKCETNTTHKANDLKWNVWLHLILTLLTGFFYLIPFVVYYIIKESMHKMEWMCTRCEGIDGKAIR